MIHLSTNDLYIIYKQSRAPFLNYYLNRLYVFVGTTIEHTISVFIEKL